MSHDIKSRIAQALSDIALRNSAGPQFPQFTGVGPGPDYSFLSGDSGTPIPRPRPEMQAQPMNIVAGQQPMNLVPSEDALAAMQPPMNFAGAKGPQWTDQEFQNFWNRANPTG